MIKKAFYFFAVAFYVLGTLVGIILTLASKIDLPAMIALLIVIAGLAGMAFPTAKSFYKKFTDDTNNRNRE